MRTARSAALEAVLAVVVAVIVAAIGLFAFSLVQWPSFNSSNVLRALTTVGQVAAFAVIGLSVWMLRSGRRQWIAKVLSWAGLSAFVTVTLGMPLAATKLYLFGVSVDQEFRTTYLTRLTDSAALHDMTYANLPPYYPAGWFWIGGRVANLLGMDGWEAFKPYAIGSLAVACVVALVLWSNLVRSDLAVLVATATAALTLAYASPESYGAVVAVLVPPVLLLAWGALARPVPFGPTSSGLNVAFSPVTGLNATFSPTSERKRAGWAAALAVGAFLGFAATFYTLYLGIAAFTVTLMALTAAAIRVRSTGSWRGGITPLLKLVVIGVVSGLIALIVWGPYLKTALSGATAESGTALHYLPESGASLPFPMLQFSLLGGLCMIGTVWIIVRIKDSRRAQALAFGVVATYLFALLSMAVTAIGTTLLGFRLEPILILILGSAGVFGFIDGARALYLVASETPRVRTVTVAVGIIGALAFAQNIPGVLGTEIDVAYTDTDGNGVRADQRPPSAVSYYSDVDRALQEALPSPRNDTVVLTADTTFLAIYPYLGFQGPTSHYANPLADYSARAAAIAEWAKADGPDGLVDKLDTSQWRAPDAFLFRRGADGSTLRLAEDVYPNDPNVRRYTVSFPESLFDDPRFTVTDIGPFVLATRTP